MKNFNIKTLIALATVAVLSISCSKTLDIEVAEAYIPSNLDLNAGSWKTYVLTSNSEVAVAAPKATSDPAYLKELDSLKTKIYPALTYFSSAGVTQI